MVAKFCSIDILDAILLLKALDQRPDHNIHAWYDTSASCHYNLGLLRIAVDLRRSRRAQELETGLELGKV